MKLTKTLKPLLFLVSILAIVAIACGSRTPAERNALTSTPRPTAVPKVSVDLEVFNETEASLCYLLVAPSDEEFNKEYLDGVEIAPGESYTVSGFDTGEYNVKVHNCDKNLVNALYYVDMDQEHMTWTIRDATLKVVNESSQIMCELYVSPSSAPEAAWGPNQIEGTNFETDMYVDFYIAQGKWDIRMVPCDESVDSITEIGLKVENELTYTISDEE
ncbi:MAG TPA: hypothetical protein VJ972_09555 [Anaerolineales bacterium]|nr:hypothetical protein [Anaerolineales bacterium]